MVAQNSRKQLAIRVNQSTTNQAVLSSSVGFLMSISCTLFLSRGDGTSQYAINH